MTTTIPAPSATASRSIWRIAGIAGVVAAVATTAIGAIAKAADVPLVVGDMKIQIPAFAMFPSSPPRSVDSSPPSCRSEPVSPAAPS